MTASPAEKAPAVPRQKSARRSQLKVAAPRTGEEVRVPVGRAVGGVLGDQVERDGGERQREGTDNRKGDGAVGRDEPQRTHRHQRVGEHRAQDGGRRGLAAGHGAEEAAAALVEQTAERREVGDAVPAGLRGCCHTRKGRVREGRGAAWGRPTAHAGTQQSVIGSAQSATKKASGSTPGPPCVRSRSHALSTRSESTACSEAGTTPRA